MSNSSTDRRSFLKVGALAATPVAMFAPAAVMAADDGSRARLAQLEDEKAIGDLTRAFLRRFNGKDVSACRDLVASSDAVRLAPDMHKIIEDAADEARLEFAEDGTSASYRRACSVERVTHFTGDSTVEQMARFQGQTRANHKTRGVLDAQFARTADGWTITRLAIA